MLGSAGFLAIARNWGGIMRWIHLLAIGSLATASVANLLQLRADDSSAIYVMNVDGSGLRKAAQVEGFKWHASPRWSHDGTRLAFEAYGGQQGTLKIYIANIDGAAVHEVAEHSTPSWSPDD